MTLQLSETTSETKFLKVQDKMLEKLLTSIDDDVQEYICEILDSKNIPYHRDPMYIVTQIEGNHPLICTHTDIVGLIPPNRLQEINGVVSVASIHPSKCLGADDRAGIWIALQMILQGTTTVFNYGFFSGEERGCVGSQKFIKDLPIDNYTCFIGLDRASRKGVQNVATYGYDNTELIQLFVDYGYEEQSGTFTDCSTLAGHSNVACINLSVGYQKEHSITETLDIALMKETLEVMLDVDIPEVDFEATINKFEYFPEYGYKYNRKGNFNFNFEFEDDEEDIDTFDYSYHFGENPKVKSKCYPICCDYCGEHEKLYEDDFGNLLCKDCIEIVRMN